MHFLSLSLIQFSYSLSSPKYFHKVVGGNFRLDSFTGLNLDFSGENDINLTKEGNDWSVNSFAADFTKVDQLLQALDTAAVSSLASTNGENHSRFQVGEATS